MSDAWDERRRRERRRQRAREREERRRRSRSRSKQRSREKPELSPEERALRDARRTAERKVAFVRHLIVYCFVLFFLMFVVGRVVAGIVGLGWGIGLASHFFQAIVAPELRRKWIAAEVHREVERTAVRQRRALQGETSRSLEELSASIAHEIRNPITAAKSLVQQMGEDPASNENVEYAGVALTELDRVEKSISHLLRYAREEEMQVRSMRLSEAADGALETLKDRIEKLGVTVERSFDAEGEMDGDPNQLRRVFINLIGNALDVLEEGGTESPHIEIGVGENLAGTSVWARIKDNGAGMDADMQAKIFKPFFTSKESGTGLGLAITRKLVAAHSGEIELRSRPGSGTEFELTFPKHGSIHGSAQ